MTSASTAVKRLKSESLQQKALNELKQDALELGLTKEDIKRFGNLSHKATWLTAINDAIGREFETVETVETENNITVTVNQIEIDEELIEASEVVNPENLPTLAETDPRFELWQSWMTSGATFTTGRQVYTILYFDVWGNCHVKGADTRWHSFRLETIVNTATDDYVQKSEPIPPLTPVGESGQLSDCLESPTPIRDQLFSKMMAKGLSLSDLEQLQNEPLDEDTATVFLTLLEESDRMLSEALAL